MENDIKKYLICKLKFFIPDKTIPKQIVTTLTTLASQATSFMKNLTGILNY